MAEYLIQDTTLAAIADAVRAKTKRTDPIPVDRMAQEITTIIEGTVLRDVETVDFYDYDGTLVASYSVEEANNLTSLPMVPEHEGLTFQGWNYTLEEVRATTHMLDVGANYITTDGKTRFYFLVLAPTTFTFNFTQTVSGGAVIDWGDGTSDTLTGTALSHTYTAGEYCAELTVNDGNTVRLGNGSSSKSIFYNTSILIGASIGKNIALNTHAFYGQSGLRKVSIPTHLNMSNYSFFGCSVVRCIVIPKGTTAIQPYAFRATSSLAVISIPIGITRIETYTFGANYNMRRLIIPDGVTYVSNYSFDENKALGVIYIPNTVTSLPNDLFRALYSLKSVNIPSACTTIGNEVWYSCYAIREVVIPEGVKTIGSNVFYACYSLEKIVFPRTISSVGTNLLQRATNAKIYAPDDMVATYKAMTNLSTYAHQIFPISEMPQD